MCDVRIIRQNCDKLVSTCRRILGDAPKLHGEGREEQHPPRVERSPAFGRDAHGFDGACGADDYRLLAAQENPQAFPFDRRVEAADDSDALVAQSPGHVVGAQDGIARRAGGAKKCGLAIGEERHGADRRQRGRSVFSKAGEQDAGIKLIASGKAMRSGRLFSLFTHGRSFPGVFTRHQSVLPTLRITAHALLDVVVDDEIKLFLREAVVPVHFVVDTRPARL